jgi:RHS repeat-associated protein
MPNRRTLRRLARTGDPVLLSIAGPRAGAVSPAESLITSEGLVLRLWYSYDAEGNRTAVTSFAHRPGEPDAPEIVSYDGFGNALSMSDPPADRYHFTGRDLASVTAMQYNRARYFDPKPGRWLTEEPPDLDAPDPNVYRFVASTRTPSDPAV